MSLKHRFFIMCGAFVAGILIALLCELWPALSVLIPIGALLPLGGVIWGVISIRCPHCGAFLFRCYFTPYCPHCGKDLDWH
ncbi:MAG: hypothetical protein KH295_03440 [Clostridiaceae bacterium]|nr:hypothetical protein [uncultured Agathobaculum sp.]MBS6640087.1 hypothetical protein [Clostridiaceae bacterium]HIX11762.1 hypothetical protein [Candidatus Agathobaculum pullistercoris]